MSSSMIRFALRLAALFAFALLPDLASAQSWLYVTLTPRLGDASTLLEVPLTTSGLGGMQRQIALPGRAGPAVVSSDGRYVMFTVHSSSSGSSQLGLFDRRSGAVTLIPGAVPIVNLRLGSGPLSDPTTLRLFFFNENALTVIEPGGVRTMLIPTIDTWTPQLSSDGRELFVSSFTPPGPFPGKVFHIAVLDPVTGAVRRHLPELEGTPASMALSREGQRLFVTMNVGPSVRLLVLDAVSGAELLRRDGLANPSIGTETVGRIVADDRNNRLFVSSSVWTGTTVPLSNLFILDMSTLNVIGNGGPGTSSVAIDRTLGMVVTAGVSYAVPPICDPVNVSVWDASPSPVESFGVNLGDHCPSLTIATPPDAPADLTHTLNGSGVTFNWSGVPGATGYVIEAGSTSGSSNLARIETDQPTFVVAGVPPGTYHVRARALNDVGPSAASNEILVTVP